MTESATLAARSISRFGEVERDVLLERYSRKVPAGGQQHFINGQPALTTQAIGQQIGRSHKNVIRAVRKAASDDNFNRLNIEPITFRDVRGRTQPMFLLSEAGAAFVIGKLVGLDVEQAKKNVALAYGRLRAASRRAAAKALRQDPQWQVARIDGKATRRSFTDVCQRFVEHATAGGSKNADRYYQLTTKMVQGTLFHEPEDDRRSRTELEARPSIRERLTQRQLARLADCEDLVARTLDEAIAAGVEYHSAFRLAKHRAEAFAGLVGRSRIGGTYLEVQHERHQ